MIGFIFILLVALLVYFILSETITIRLLVRDTPRLRISFVFFSISFNLNSRKKKKPIRKKINSSLFSIRLLNEILSRSYVNVNSYSFDEFVIGYQNLPRLFPSVIAPAFLAYLKSRSSYLEFSESSQGEGIDISIDIPLFSLFISLIKTVYYNSKRKLARN